MYQNSWDIARAMLKGNFIKLKCSHYKREKVSTYAPPQEPRKSTRHAQDKKKDNSEEYKSMKLKEKQHNQ